jgi:spermidine synthase
MGQGYDLVLLGQATPAPINLDELEARLDRPEYARVAKSLEDLGFYSASDLLGTYVARAADLQAWLAGAVINRDRNLRLQYLAGLGLNEKGEALIFNHMLASGPQFSPEVFQGSGSLTEYLKRAIESGSSR